MKKYDFFVWVVVESTSEDEALQNLTKYLKMADMDFGLTYGITNTEIMDFVDGKDCNV